MRALISLQFVKFIIVGILNTLFGYSIFAVFIYLGLHYSVAVLLSTVLGVLFNYKTIGKFVFSDIESNMLGKFIAVYSIIYILNISGLFLFGLFGLDNKYIAGALLLAPLAIVSFVLNKKFVFVRNYEKN